MAPRRRERQRGWNLKLRSFRTFALFLLLLCVLLAFAPAVLLFRRRSTQILNRKCSWLHNRPLVCAHGGDTSSAPPNTVEAYNRALKTKVDCIEIDASRTRDGVLVALHDRDLQKIYGNDHIRVGDLSYSEIAKLDAGYKSGNGFQNQMVPMLTEALQQQVSRYVKQVIIDAKLGPPLFEFSLAADLLHVVNITQCKNCLVWSKSDYVVRELKKLASEVKAGYIVMRDEATGRITNPFRMKAMEVVGAYHGAVNTKTVSDIHKVGKSVYVWTVDDKETMKTMLFDRVDAIVTSQPSLLQEVMLEVQSECFREGYSL